MELRLFPLLVGFVVGTVTGATARRKDLMKSMAKGYLAMEERTKGMMADVREEMRDAIEEARYEREQEAILREDAVAAAMQEQEAGAPLAEQDTSPQQADSHGTAAVPVSQ